MSPVRSSAPKRSGAQQDDVLTRHIAGVPRRTLALALWLLPVVALANIAVLVWSLGTVDLAERIVAPQFLALAALLVFVPMLTNALRLALWSRFLSVPLGFVGALRVITGTMVANSVTPSAMGGMPIKILFLLGEKIELRRAIALVCWQAAEDALILFSLVALTAAISGLAMLDFLGADAGLLASLDDNLVRAAMIAGALLMALAALGSMIGAGLFGHRIKAWIAKRLQQLRMSAAMMGRDWSLIIRTGKSLALLNLCIAAIQWSVRFSIAGLVLAAFGTSWQPALFWLMQYLVQTISSTVPSPGGVGGAEAGFLLMFSSFVERTVILPAMSAWRLLFFYVPLTAAAIIFTMLRRHPLRSGSLVRSDAPAMSAQLPAE